MADVYYSVGQNTTNHSSGGNVAVSGGVATFSVAQTATNLGVGDRLTANSIIHYLKSKISTTQWNVVNALGVASSDLASTAVTSIAHEYTSLSAAEAGATDANHINNTNLVTAVVILNIPCYYDTGADTTLVTIDGYTTGLSNYIRIYTPTNTSTECNQTQRHSGVWFLAPAYYAMDNQGVGTGRFINILDDYVRVDGLQIYSYSAADYMDAVNVTASATSDVRISNCILKGGTTKGGSGIYLSTTGIVRAYNNIVYDYVRPAVAGDGITLNGGTMYSYNNTMYKNYRNLSQTGGTLIAKSNLCYSSVESGGNYFGTFNAGSTNNLSGPGTDAGMPTTNSRNGVTVTFINTTAGSEDLHVASSDVGAKGYGINLSADANIAITDDIDGHVRVGAWTIGADQVERKIVITRWAGIRG